MFNRECTWCANKNHPLEKFCISAKVYKQNFVYLYENIHTTYPANFIETTDMVQQIQQFKFQRPIFQVNMQLCMEYSQITNQTAFINSSNVSVINVSGL